MIIDKLYEEVEKKGPICIGLDTDMSYLAEDFYPKSPTNERLFNFNKEIIDATKDLCPVYKIQIAYYEKEGLQGMLAYSKTLKYLRKNKIISIGDIKRGDIAQTGTAYAKGHFEGDFECDFITISPYMGFDSLDPFIPYIESGKKGIFVLVRTSNPGAGDIQDISQAGKTVYSFVGDYLNKLSKKYLGTYGYSPIGAVVGGTSPEEVELIRKRYQNLYFLIPGYGAQGASAEDVKKGLINGNGAVVNSSRGIITNHIKNSSKEVGHYAREATIKMLEEFNV